MATNQYNPNTGARLSSGETVRVGNTNTYVTQGQTGTTTRPSSGGSSSSSSNRSSSSSSSTPTPTLNTYNYVNTSGQVQTVQASSASAAMASAPNIASNSGVQLVSGGGSSTNVVAPAGSAAGLQAFNQSMFNYSTDPNINITPDGLTNPNVNIPIVDYNNQNNVDASTLTASALAQQKLNAQIAANIKASETSASKNQTDYDTILNDILTGQKDLANKGSDTLDAEEAAGINSLNADKAAIDAQVLSGLAEYNQLKAQYDTASIENRNRPVTMNSIIGSEAAIDFARSQKLNNKAADIGLLQAQSLGLAGQINAAQKAVDRAIDLKYADMEALIQVKITQLGSIEAELSKEEKKTALYLAQQYDQQQNAIDDQKAQEKINFSTGQDWAKEARDAGQSGLAAQISSLDISSPTYMSDLARLQKQISSKAAGFSGYSGNDTVAIKNDIAEFGLDKVLEGVTDPKEVAAITALSKTIEKKVSRSDIETIVTQKVAMDQLRETYTDAELKELANDSGASKWWTGKDTDIDRFLNSADARKVYVDLLFKQYESAGMTK